MKDRDYIKVPRWIVGFFFLFHLLTWFISFGQTLWIINEVRKRYGILYNNLVNKFK